MELIELGSILHMTKGKKPKALSNIQKDGYLPYVDIEAFETGIIKKFTNGENCVPCEDGDILIVCDGSRSGLVGRAIKGYVGSTLAKIEADGLSNDYLYRYVQGKYILLNTNKKGTGTPHLKAELLKAQKLVVPYYDEQSRIVSRVDEILSQLDNGVATLKKTQEQLEVYRQAVLKRAFDFEKDIFVPVSSICNVVRGGSPRPAGDERYYNGCIPFVKVADITNTPGMYLNSCEASIKEAGLRKTRFVEKNTLLLSNSGATLGVPKICTFPTTFNDGVAAFLNFDSEKEHLPYHYWFWYSMTLPLRAINQGAAQPNLNTDIIGNINIPHPCKEEQIRTAERIDAQLTVCDDIERTIETARLQAQSMRQSVLKKAFEGRL